MTCRDCEGQNENSSMKKLVSLVSVLATVTVLAEDKRPVVATNVTTVVYQPVATIYTTTEQTPSGTITRVYARKGVTKDNSTGVPVTRYGDPQFMGSHFTPSEDVASPRVGDHVWGDGILPANVQPVTMEKFVWADPPPPQVTYVTVNSGYSYYPYYHTSYGRDWYGGGGYVRGGYVHGGRTYYGGSVGGGRTYYGGQGPRGGSVPGGHTYQGGQGPPRGVVGGSGGVRGSIGPPGGQIGGGRTYQGGRGPTGGSVGGGSPVRGGSVGGGVIYRGSGHH